jgi:5-formyltetrahydrofolate cyclo-ligase
MTKSELRRIYLERRIAHSTGEVAEQSQLIGDRFFASFDLVGVHTLHCFISIAKFNEIDTAPLFEKIWTDFPRIRTLAPLANLLGREMESCVYTSSTELAENEWGILEPKSGAFARPLEIDMVLVPLLCFDERGHRVGYGKGFYDKFLSRCRPDCVKVGLCIFPSVNEIVDATAFDVKLDFCVTPEAVISFANSTTS